MQISSVLLTLNGVNNPPGPRCRVYGYEVTKGHSKWLKNNSVICLSCVAGIVSSLDIGLSNWSFDFISVSL